MRTRRKPCTRTRTVPSGTRTIRCTTAAVPISWSCSGGGSATSGSRLTTSASRRSGRFITSSMRRIERASPIASGATASGKTTVSFRGSTGSVSGSAGISSAPSPSAISSAAGGSTGSRASSVLTPALPPAEMSTRRSGAFGASGRAIRRIAALVGGRRGGGVDRHAQLQAALERAPGDLGVVVDAPAAEAPPPLAAHHQHVALQRRCRRAPDRPRPRRSPPRPSAGSPSATYTSTGARASFEAPWRPPGKSSANSRSTSSLNTGRHRSRAAPLSGRRGRRGRGVSRSAGSQSSSRASRA